MKRAPRVPRRLLRRIETVTLDTPNETSDASSGLQRLMFFLRMFAQDSADPRLLLLGLEHPGGLSFFTCPRRRYRDLARGAWVRAVAQVEAPLQRGAIRLLAIDASNRHAVETVAVLGEQRVNTILDDPTMDLEAKRVALFEAMKLDEPDTLDPLVDFLRAQIAGRGFKP